MGKTYSPCDGIMTVQHAKKWCRVWKWLHGHLWWQSPWMAQHIKKTKVNAGWVEKPILKNWQVTILYYLLHWSCPSELYTTLSIKNWDTEKCMHTAYKYQDVGCKITESNILRLLIHIFHNLQKKLTSSWNPYWQVTDMGAPFHSSNATIWNAVDKPKFSSSQKIQSVSVCWKGYVTCILRCGRRPLLPRKNFLTCAMTR